MDEFNHDNNHTYSEGDVHSVIPNDNSYTSMETPVQSHEQASFTNTNTIEDRYDDLKTSSFYNESYKKPAKGRLKGMLVPLIVVALLSSLLTGGVVGAYFTFGLPHTYNSGTGGYSSPNNTLVKEGTGSSKQIEIVDKSTSVASAVAEKVGPAIVGINVTYQYSDAFFGTQKNQEQGSGIIYRNDGYIITNNHVIESAMLGSSNKTIAPSAKIEVVLPNQEGKPYAATVIGRDPKTDIAVIKINASELPTAVLGDSDKVKVGQTAIAIGNPAGLEFMGSVTSGIISGLNRTIDFGDGKSMKLIQTDAAINPGNSGGALLNSEGQVVGINTSKIGGEGYEGLGFAIPSNRVKEIAENLISNGYVKGRPQLGISVDTRFNKEIADQNKVPEGILVSDVVPLSGAYKAGIKAGDIITKFNGVAITSFDELEAEKNKFKAGDIVDVTLYRIPDKGPTTDGVYKTVKVTLGEEKK